MGFHTDALKCKFVNFLQQVLTEIEIDVRNVLSGVSLEHLAIFFGADEFFIKTSNSFLLQIEQRE